MKNQLDVLLKYGRITQDKHDRLIAKESEKSTVTADFKKNKDKKTKAELIAIIDKLTN